MSDVLQEAREMVLKIMREPGRNAMVQLQACKLILDTDGLKHLTDEALLAEVKRRNESRGLRAV